METQEKYLVYIVDDDELFLSSLKHQLESKWQEHLEVKTFHTGEEMLKYMPEQKPEIIILDYILNSKYPYAMDGALALQKIKQIYPDIKVIMLSGQCKIQVALDIMQNGAFDYIIKNDNVFLKMHSSVKKAIGSISDHERSKKYWMWAGATILLAGLTTTSVWMIKLLFFAN